MATKQKKRARSWRKMFRARSDMQRVSYELELDEFVRQELQLQGKKRTTNVWMDYVKEQKAIEEAKKQTHHQHFSSKAADDWNACMEFTLTDDETDNSMNTTTHQYPLTTPPPLELPSRSTHSISQSTSSNIDNNWPPLNLDSPWPRISAHSVKGKGSFRLVDQTSYQFSHWARQTTSLPPVSIECRNKLIERRRNADGQKMRPPSASEEKAKKEATKKRQHRKAKQFNVMYIDPKDKKKVDDRVRREKEADAETMEDNVLLTVDDDDAAADAACDAAVDDDDAEGEEAMTGWVKFMEEHTQQRRERYLEDGPDPLPPSALVRGHMVVNKDFVPGEPSKRKSLRLEQDIMKTCTDPSKILPIPTLNRRQYKVVLDYVGEQLRIRNNLTGMENAEREMHQFLKQERRNIIAQRGAQDDQKAVKALMMFLKRAMVLCFHEWHEYTAKTNKARKFMRKILMAKQLWVFDTFKYVRSTLQEIKRYGVTLLQANIRRFVDQRKYLRLIIRVRAKICIKRAWRAYCARNLLSRMIAKREEEERRVHQQLRRILLRHVVKIIHGWREHTKIMRFANMMGAGNTRKRKKDLFGRWKQKITWLLHKRPICAKRIQQFVRRSFNIARFARIMTMHRAAKPIQRMARARIAATLLVRMKQRREVLMIKVRKRMRAETDRILQACLNILHHHAKITIEHRSKLSGFVAFKTKKLLSKWRKVTVEQIQERLNSVLIIQRCYRGLLGRRLAEEKERFVQAEQDVQNKSRQMSELDALMQDRGPKLDPVTGLPIISRSSKRLDLLLEEKIEVDKVMKKVKKITEKASSKFASKKSKEAAKKMENVQFDSKVLSFSQRFRLRTDTSFLIGFLDDEIKVSLQHILTHYTLHITH
jgi:hypothetical protein